METQSKRTKKTNDVFTYISKDVINLLVQHLNSPKDIGCLRLVCKDYARWVPVSAVQSRWLFSDIIPTTECTHCNIQDVTQQYYSRQMVLNNFNFETVRPPRRSINAYNSLLNNFKKKLKCGCNELRFDKVASANVWQVRPMSDEFIRCDHECWCLECLIKMKDTLVELARNECDEQDSEDDSYYL